MIEAPALWAAVDPGAKMGVAIFEGTTPVEWRTFPRKEYFKLRGYLQGCQFMVVEDAYLPPGKTKNLSTVKSLARAQGYAIACSEINGVLDYELVQPSWWRKRLGLPAPNAGRKALKRSSIQAANFLSATEEERKGLHGVPKAWKGVYVPGLAGSGEDAIEAVLIGMAWCVERGWE
jgi:hypothetical protein